MTDPVEHPPHYTSHTSGLECVSITRGLTFTVGNAVKLVWRHEAKNGVEDLKKARWYLRDAIAHDDPIFPSHEYRQLVSDNLRRVLDHESGLRHSFFMAIDDLDLDWALDVVQGLIDEARGVPPRNDGDGIVAALTPVRTVPSFQNGGDR